MQTQRFSFTILFFLCCLSVVAQNRTDYALFFVTTDFDYWTDFPKSTARQVEEIEGELKTNYGFKTEVVYNPTRKEILHKLLSYRNKSYGEKGQLLIYFSQHGHYKEYLAGALIPKDGLLEDPLQDSWIRHPYLADLVNSIPSEHILLALDACYSGTFGGSRGKPVKPDWENKKDCKDRVDNALLHKSRLYLTSGGKERTPTDSEFADKFLEALRLHNENGLLGFHKLYSIVSNAVPRPHFGEFKDHIKGGDFVFVHQSNCSNNSSDLDNMVFIPRGKFMMGSDKKKDEQPIHNVLVNDFYLSRYEVTYDEFDSYCISTGKSIPNESETNRGNLPVTDISWLDAINYCNWLSNQQQLKPVYFVYGEGDVDVNWTANGYRLPTEAEWEFAARSGGKNQTYSGTSINNEVVAYGNFCDENCDLKKELERRNDGYRTKAPVGSFFENDIGLFDMSGNVWELCWDWYDERYYRESKNPGNPKGPKHGVFRVIKGGAWSSDFSSLRCTERSKILPKYKTRDIGFRLAKSAR